MEAELTSVQRISCLQRTAAEKLSKKKLLEIILNGVFAEKPIDEPDEICYNITNTSEDGADQAQFESPLRCVAKRKRGFCAMRSKKNLVIGFLLLFLGIGLSGDSLLLSILAGVAGIVMMILYAASKLKQNTSEIKCCVLQNQ